ncbi:MAG TPA: dihydrolipoamide acetyltransferase family protein [Saprospiraceae bacterium]|nr:dihydrolipoamide acetyltransferase family protein [Saprospiraceae bacterium]
MADVIRMPRLSDTMTEGVIKAWNKKVGDKVAPGDVLAEVETDKATMDLEAFQDGQLLYIAVNSGAVPVDGIIAIIGKAGEAYEHLLQSSPQETKKAEPNPVKSTASETNSVQTTSSNPSPDSRVKASPLAKSIAKETGVDLSKLQGSGDHGRIVRKDVEAAVAGGNKSVLAVMNYPQKGDQEVTVSQMRKTIAKRLAESKFSAPHFYLTTEVDVDQLVEARNQVNAVSEQKISYNDFIVKACALALRKNPAINISWMGDKIVFHGDIHIGVAVAIEDGLVVPVIRNTDQKTISQIKSEIQDKAERAKSKKLALEEMQGNTFTISNLGMFDIEDFTAIINPPDACILAVGSIAKKVIVKNDQMAIGNRMRLTLSCDHRAVDGATGAKFLQTLKSLLENPMSLVL